MSANRYTYISQFTSFMQIIMCYKIGIFVLYSLIFFHFLLFFHFFFFFETVFPNKLYLMHSIQLYTLYSFLCYNIPKSLSHNSYLYYIIERMNTLKEKLYTIPVTDAFRDDCECPLCSMYHELETQSIEYTMGPSYMEDDTRAETDKLGFCQRHIKQMYANQNRLGIALILDTHMNEILRTIERLSKNAKPTTGSLFRKPAYTDVKSYIDYLESNCFVCNRINKTFERYLATIFYLYKTEEEFRKTFQHSKGFCTKHYGMLYQMAGNYLSGATLNSFIEELNTLYLDNMKRVKEDLEWFRDKFDYRNQDAPWKNSRDAVPRTLMKINSIMNDDIGN